MALTRKMLKAMGIEEEKIEQIIEAHSETVSGLKADIEKYKGDAEKLPGVQKELDTLKAAGDGGWKEKHDTVKKELDTLKAENTKKETRAAKEKAWRALLKETGVSEKRIDVVVRATDLDGIELAEDGKIKDADKHTEAIKKDWGDFIVTKKKEGTQTQNPPANGGGDGPKTREEIYKKDDKGRFLLDASARQKALAELMNNNNTD